MFQPLVPYSNPQSTGPATTAKSALEGRLMVDVGSKKKKILKNHLKKVTKTKV